MAARTGQGATQGQHDPLVEALLKELIGETSHPQTGKKDIIAVLTEEVLASLKEAEHPVSQEISLETVIIAEALAPALAQALAEALAPALVKAVNNLVASKQTAQKTASKQSAE